MPTHISPQARHIRQEKNGLIIFRRGEAGRNADLKASASGI